LKHALALIFLLSATLSGAAQAGANNCVAYVKAVTGFSLMGDAWQWWGAAQNVYERGYVPAPGAVMVFSRSGRMHVGHVAVVREIVGPREILIDQANWHHGRVDRGVSIHDLSLNNDWSSVEVEWSKGVYGGPFPITGFVYAPGTPLSAEARRPLIERAQPQLVMASARSMNKGKLILAGGRNAMAQHGSIREAGLTAPAKSTHQVSHRATPAVSKAEAKPQEPRASKAAAKPGEAKLSKAVAKPQTAKASTAVAKN